MEYSMLYSEDDAISRPNSRLLDLAIDAISNARNVSFDEIAKRMGGRFSFADSTLELWPGEHYKLLASLVKVLNPGLVVEIGTAEGLSALCMRKYLSPSSRLITFDIVPWSEYPRTCLAAEDFEGGQLTQTIADLGDLETFNIYRNLLKDADLIFIDAAKDGVLEHKFIANFQTLRFDSKPIFVFDDIRLWNMLSIWRELNWPKLDVTSFGHWCGTGICDPANSTNGHPQA
jgi:predicted O-methyltransferase YrrM